jgi:hypothetical protein
VYWRDILEFGHNGSKICTKVKYLFSRRNMDNYGEERRVLLGAFATVRKATISFAMSCPSVCSSVRMEHLGYHWMNFHEILCLSISRISIEKIRVSLKFDKCNGYFR